MSSVQMVSSLTTPSSQLLVCFASFTLDCQDSITFQYTTSGSNGVEIAFAAASNQVLDLRPHGGCAARRVKHEGCQFLSHERTVSEKGGPFCGGVKFLVPGCCKGRLVGPNSEQRIKQSVTVER